MAQPAALLAELLACPAERRVTIARNIQRFASPHLVQRLLDQAYELRFTDANSMVNLCETAAAIADRLESDDLRASAWAYLGNSFKVAGQFSKAERAFARARRFEGPRPAPQIQARRLEFEGALRLRQARLQEAVSALSSALALREQLADPVAVISVKIQLGLALHEAGDLVPALRLFTWCNRHIDRTSHPRLALIAQHNGVLVLTSMGRAPQAEAALDMMARLYESAGDPVMLLRRRWLLAQIAASYGSAGRDAQAEREFSKAIEDAISGGLVYEAAKLHLDLAVFYAVRRRTDMVPPLLDQALPLFLALGIGREALASRALRRAAAAARAADAAQALTLLREAERRLGRFAA